MTRQVGNASGWKRRKKNVKKMERAWCCLGHVGPKFGLSGWVYMGLFSKEWAWVEGKGFKRCKGAE